MNAAPVLPPPPPKTPLHSPTETLVDRDPLALDAAIRKIEEEDLAMSPVLSTFRRYVLLLIFCLAQFLDAFNNSALFPAIPTLVDALGMTSSEQVWIISAFQLTFASFLLIVSSAFFGRCANHPLTMHPPTERTVERCL